MTAIPVFYRPEQVAPEQGYSPSAAKPAKVVAEWERRQLPIELHSFTPVTPAGLSMAHDSKYVRDVLACREDNGFGTRDAAVAASLPYTVGSMVAAAVEAHTSRRVAVSPTSGFHHAEYDVGGGYCTFNGLVVAARKVLKLDPEAKLAILDCDQHYGNGTDDILHRFPSLDSKVRHLTMGGKRLRRGQATEYLTKVVEALHFWKEAGVQTIIYQAGADPHVNDPLGGLLTDEELRRRDAAVFEVCKALDMGVAWNLAGGYQRTEDGGIQPVLDIHNATMEECIRVFCS